MSTTETGMICLYFGRDDECRYCGGWTKAAGGPFAGDSRFCSEDCFADAAAALAGVDWQARAEAAETRLAAVAAHCRERLNGAGRYGLSMTAARHILSLAEGSTEEKQS